MKRIIFLMFLLVSLSVAQEAYYTTKIETEHFTSDVFIKNRSAPIPNNQEILIKNDVLVFLNSGDATPLYRLSIGYKYKNLYLEFWNPLSSEFYIIISFAKERGVKRLISIIFVDPTDRFIYGNESNYNRYFQDYSYLAKVAPGF